MKFQLLIDWDVVAFIEKLSSADRRRLRNAIADLRENPEFYADFFDADMHGRPLAVHLCDRFAIKYWIDHADLHVKVLDIICADGLP